MTIIMKQRKKGIRFIVGALLIVFILVVFMVALLSNTAKAEVFTPTETVIKTYTGFVDGVERTLVLTKNASDKFTPYLKIGDWDNFIYASTNSTILDAGLDKYGTVQILCTDKMPYWWSYDLTPDYTRKEYNVVPNPSDPIGYMHDIVSFDFEGTGEDAIIVGYKSVSGETYPLPSFAEMKEVAGSDSPIEPSYVTTQGTPESPTPPTSTPVPPTPTIPRPESPSIETSAPPTVAPPTQIPPISGSPTLVTPIPTPLTSTLVPIIGTYPPSVTVQPTATPKVSKKLSIKTSKKKGKTTSSLCEGNKTVIEYTLKKGNLTWKVGKKKGNAKGVKYAGFIKNSKNLFFMDKKGKGFTVSSKNGKKKLIINKGAKKPSSSGGFVVKVMTASGPFHLSNK